MTTLTRRTLMVGGAALTLTALGTTRGWTQASVEGVARRKVGGMEVVGLLDGRIQLEAKLFSGAPDDKIAEMIGGQPVDGFINAFVVQTADGPVMIDAGAGPALGPAGGKLAERLQAAGIDPAAVTTFYATHLHPDHVGGLVGENPIQLPNAQMVVHEQERAFWTNDEIMKQAGEANEAFFQTARNALAAFGDRVTTFTGEDVPGPLQAMELFGHTPGHTGYVVADGSDSMLIWGDIVHAPVLQFPDPSITISFDVDPAAAEATRKRVMDMAATDKMPVGGMHLVFPAMGTVTKSGDGYAFQTEA